MHGAQSVGRISALEERLILNLHQEGDQYMVAGRKADGTRVRGYRATKFRGAEIFYDPREIEDRVADMVCGGVYKIVCEYTRRKRALIQVSHLDRKENGKTCLFSRDVAHYSTLLCRYSPHYLDRTPRPPWPFIHDPNRVYFKCYRCQHWYYGGIIPVPSQGAQTGLEELK
jgi:hypothetical protein